MKCVPVQTWLFYGVAITVEVCIAAFIGQVLRKALQNAPQAQQWRWSSEDSRDTWIDAAKTLISAAAVASAILVAFPLATRSTNSLDDVARFSLRVATICLIVCVFDSMFLIVALVRGHEAAKARHNLECKAAGHSGQVTEGPLTVFALVVIAISGFIALSSFAQGFLFLTRVIWHA